MKMKKPLALMIAGGTMMGTLTAGLGTTVSQAATTQVSIEEPAQITTLDPGNYNGQILLDQGTIMQGLYGFNQKNQIVPELATGYKISNGGMTWTFTIRKGARWSNGDPVTAQDFYYSFMHQLNPANTGAQLWAGVLNDVANSWAYHAGTVPKSSLGIKVINNYTLQITTDAVVDLLPYLVEAGSMPLDPKIVEAHTDWATSSNFPSDGPYMVKSFTPNGEIVLVKNPYYVPPKGQPVGNVSEFNVIPTATVPLEDFLSHKFDVALLTNISDVKYAETDKALKNELHIQPTDTMYSLRYDKSVAPSPLLTNQKLRLAIAEAINRSPLANSVFHGMVGAANTFSTPGWPTQKYEHPLPSSVAQAQKLEAEAGYPHGKGLPTFYLYAEVQSSDPYGVLAAEALQEEFKNTLGINFQIVPLASTQYGALNGNGMITGIKPGYFIGSQGVLRMVPGLLVMQQNIGAGTVATYGYPNSLNKLIYQWETTQYNPPEIKRYGNPNNSSLGVKWSDWVKMNEDALKDIKYLNAFNAKLPEPYRSEVVPTNSVPLMKQWQTIVDAWRTAKTAVAKHAAWETAWTTLGSHETTTGQADPLGWNEQVLLDKKTPPSMLKFLEKQAVYFDNTSLAKAAPVAAQIADQLMQEGWTEPLFYTNQVFLTNANISGVQSNPYNFGYFYNLQNISVK